MFGPLGVDKVLSDYCTITAYEYSLLTIARNRLAVLTNRKYSLLAMTAQVSPQAGLGFLQPIVNLELRGFVLGFPIVEKERNQTWTDWQMLPDGIKHGCPVQ